MKTLKFYTLFTLLFVISCMPVNAQNSPQEYFPQGTTWEEAWYSYQKGESSAFFVHLRHTVSGDTLVGDVLYKRVVTEMKILDSYSTTGLSVYIYVVDPEAFGWDNIGEWHWKTIPSNNFCLREENGAVYVNYINFGYEERKIYDFNWEEGKQIEEYIPVKGIYESYTLNDIKEITLLDGSMAQGLYTPDGGDIERIRGIGFVNSFFDSIFLDMWGIVPQFTHMISFSRNGVLLYEWDPIPYLETFYTGIKAAESSTSEKDGSIYTITGMGVKENDHLCPGIYIKDKRKIIVK